LTAKAVADPPPEDPFPFVDFESNDSLLIGSPISDAALVLLPLLVAVAARLNI
jgi:hypothetical protein